MNRLIDISRTDDIFSEYRETPIGLLLEYHNLNRPLDNCSDAQLLIGMCIDNRKHLRIPDNFSFVIRTGGANMKFSEFKISYAIAIGGIQHFALIGHNNCGMVNLHSKKARFIEGLIDKAGWDGAAAEIHFSTFAAEFEIENEIDFVLNETKRLRLLYPKIVISPMIYKVEDNRLYLIKEE